MAVQFIPIIIGGIIRLASPHVAKFLTKHGFKKATKNITQNKNKIPKINLKQAENVVTKRRLADNPAIEAKLARAISGINRRKRIPRDLIKKREKTLDDRMLDSLVDAAKNARFPPRPHQRVGDKAYPNIKTKAEELTKNPKLQKFLKSGPSKRLKKGGRIGKPKGVGIAQRGFGKAMKNGK
jgi:hypothetical protein